MQRILIAITLTCLLSNALELKTNDDEDGDDDVGYVDLITEKNPCSYSMMCGDGYCCKFNQGCICSHFECFEMCSHGDNILGIQKNYPTVAKEENLKLAANEINTIKVDYVDAEAGAGAEGDAKKEGESKKIMKKNKKSKQILVESKTKLKTKSKKSHNSRKSKVNKEKKSVNKGKTLKIILTGKLKNSKMALKFRRRRLNVIPHMMVGRYFDKKKQFSINTFKRN